MKNQLRRFALLLSVATLSCFALARTSALGAVEQKYALFQEGYAQNATVTGTFTGTDLDGNGLLVHFPTSGAFPIAHLELSAFSVHFSGNTLSPAFDLALDDLYGFVYQLGTAGIGDDPAFDPTIGGNLMEGVGAIGSAHFYTSGLGPNLFIGGYIGGHIDLSGPFDLEEEALDISTHLLRVTVVPEPVTGIMAIVGLFCIVARCRAYR